MAGLGQGCRHPAVSSDPIPVSFWLTAKPGYATMALAIVSRTAGTGKAQPGENELTRFSLSTRGEKVEVAEGISPVSWTPCE